jgi:hypothetical protein
MLEEHVAADEWMTIAEASSLVDESAATVRRRAQAGKIIWCASDEGRSRMLLRATDIWAWRADKLRRLRIELDPLLPEPVGIEVVQMSSMMEELFATKAALASERLELARLREALAMALAADDATEDRARAWKGVVRSLTAPTTAPAD